jgi:hypothetical protein
MSTRFSKPFSALRAMFSVLAILSWSACDPPRESFTRGAGANDAASVATVADAAKLPTSGDVVFAGGWTKGNASTLSAEFFDPTTRKFTSTGAMSASVGGHFAALLDSGDILVGGGFGGKAKFTKKTVSTAITGAATTFNQTYDPSTGLFSATNQNLSVGRVGATATTLVGGKVLIAGGTDSAGNPTNTAEVFDPISGTLSATTNNMDDPRSFHTATLLPSGTVLVAGGSLDDIGNLSLTADIYDPGTNSFTKTTGDMIADHAGGAAVVLTTGPDAGKVMIVGGAFGDSTALVATAFADLYNPTTKTFALTSGVMNDGRLFPTATVLANGDVLVTGGFANFFSTVSGSSGSLMSLFGSTLLSAELYDPVMGSFACVPGSGLGGSVCPAAMTIARAGHTATLFTAGPLMDKVLVAGGMGAKKPNLTSKELNAAEIYDPTANAFTKTGNMKKPRAFGTATLLP